MKKINSPLVIAFAFILITILFFYPVFLKGFVPYPGDLLLAEYQPWRSTSFNNIAAGGIPNKGQYFDTLRQMYPWKTFSIESVKNGNFPLWNPYDFSGAPLFANFQSAILFPLNVLYLILPQYMAWTVLVFLQPLLCLIAVYLLARIYKLSKTASVLSAVSYAFCLYLTTFLEYNILGHFMYLLPFGLLSIELIILKKKWAPVLLSIIVAISAFAGHTQLFAGIVLYIFLYGLIRSFQTEKVINKKLFSFSLIGLFLLLGIGLSAIQLFPGIELIRQSARSSHAPEFFFNNLLIKPEQFILYLSPDLFGNPATKNYLLPFSYPSKALYIGITALFFTILGIFIKSKNNYWKTIVILTLAVSLIVFLNPISYLLFKLNLPLISSSSPSNFIFMVSLGLCLLEGFGFDEFKKQNSRKPMIILIMLWILIFGTFAITKTVNILIVKNNLIYSALILVVITIILFILKINKKFIKYAGIAFIVISCLDLFYFFHKFNPFVPPLYIYPQTSIQQWLTKNAGINRVWGYSFANIQANFPTQMGIYSPEGYDPLYPKQYGEFIQIATNGKLPSNFNDFSRSDATIKNGYGKSSIANNPYRLKILSVLGVKYILDKTENGSTSQTFPSNLFNKVSQVDNFNVMEYKNAASRFFLTNSYEIYANNNDFVSKLLDTKFDPTKTILLDKNPGVTNITNAANLKTKLISYKPNSVEINAQTPQNSLLFLSDTYYPGWKAYVDGKETKIYKADYTFRAVIVPAGNHVISFVYKPNSFYYGIIASTLSIMTLAASYIIIVKRKG